MVDTATTHPATATRPPGRPGKAAGPQGGRLEIPLLGLLRERPEYVLSPLLFVVLIAIWHAAAVIFEPPEFILPPPGMVWSALVSGLSASPFDPSGFWYHAGVTAFEALSGFLIGSGAGITIGMAVAHSRLVERVLYPYIIAIQSLPKIAVAPLFVIWFGFGIEPKILITTIITFFPLLVNSIAGANSVDPARIDLARSCNATPMQIFFKITLPSALPFIFAGLNMAAVLSILGAIVGEFVGAQAGIGMLILQRNELLDIASVYALFVVLAAMGLSLHLTMRALERHFCFWSHRGRKADLDSV
ncbi:ABC transporter permease [Roseospira goensis]|uniref:NitT/TauT family transport system permease protein n=1 Tax=Roseospira goensis TaxID=391922 RepID=A0A7W6S137_9PROT|nr:ABC transporter permease [Roseospira goensis]MBB4286284.1 NitT/TauT family transport system permease protein [Roseospira goensis]